MKLTFLWARSLCGCLKSEDNQEPEVLGVSNNFPRDADATRVFSSPERQQMMYPEDKSTSENNIIERTSVFNHYFLLETAGNMLASDGVIRYKCGAEYRGDWRNGARNGEGEMRWSSDAWYRGTWEDDMPSGHGVMQVRPGVKFDGQWNERMYAPIHSKPMMLGSFDQWVQAVSDGYGIFYSVWLWFEIQRGHLPCIRIQPPTSPSEITLYLSDLADSIQEYMSAMDMCWQSAGPWAQITGQFIKIKLDQQLYIGCHSAGKPNGLGRLELSPGCKYEGEWVMGDRRGFGVYQWPNGKVMQGFWQGGKPHGICLLKDTKNGDEIAEWENGKKAKVLSSAQKAD